jgi:Flp pilus assembly protein TadG
MKIRMPLKERLRRRAGKRDPGQAIIEMALVMVILLILSFGVADFGLLLTAHIQTSNCAREIARRAVVRDANAAAACDGYAALNALVGSPSVSLPDYMSLDSGEPVTARIEGTYTFFAIAPLSNAFFPGNPVPATVAVGSETTMRMEGSRP